jgi:hypothetical protein
MSKMQIFPPPSLLSFAATDGRLSKLGQDTFRSVGQHLHGLDLAGNVLTAGGVNANAFRGLEASFVFII